MAWQSMKGLGVGADVGAVIAVGDAELGGFFAISYDVCAQDFNGSAALQYNSY